MSGSDEANPQVEGAADSPSGEGSASGSRRGSSAIPAIPAAAGGAAAPEKSQGDRPPDLPDFRLLAKIGQGGFGSVWIAQHRHTGDAVAIKFIPPGSRDVELQGLQHLRQRVREGQDHLVWTEYIGEAEGFIYCVMDLADPVVEGPLFADRYEALTLLKYSKQKGRLDVMEAASVTLAIAKGLAFLQAAGLRHGDIKPANILRVRGKWKLADYGMMGGLDARARGGTRSYLPPEGPHGDRADQFALGIVLYELVFGHKPSEANRPAWPESRIATGLRRIQARLIEGDASRRYASAKDLVTELESLLSASKPAASGAAGACPSCGESIYGSEEACGQCGSELWRQCPVCQHRGSIIQRYCTQCRGPVHGVLAMRKELNEADALLCDGVHRDCLQRLEGPLRDLMQEVSRDLTKLHAGDLSRRRRVEAIQAEFEGRMVRMADRCRLLQQIDTRIADAHERADVMVLRESIARALEIVPGASTYERLRADLPLLEARSRWAALLGRLGNPQRDPAALSSEALRNAIATLRSNVPEQAVARDEAKLVLAALQDEQRKRIRERCAAAAAWHRREGRPLQALRWLRIAESKHAADQEMAASIVRLSAELAPIGKGLREAGRRSLQRPGSHREMRRIASELAVVEGTDSPVAAQLRAEWPRRRRVDLLRRIADRALALVSRGQFGATDRMLAMAHRIADRDAAVRDRVIDLDNSITARIRAARELLGNAIAAESAGRPEAALELLEQAASIAPDWIEVSTRLERVRSAAAVVPIRRRRRRVATLAALAALLVAAAAVTYHVASLAPLRSAAASLADSAGGRGAEARREAMELLADPRRRHAMLITDLGLADEVRRQWELSWERTYGKEGPLAPEVAFAAADELAAWREEAASAADPWPEAASRRLASGVLAARTARIERVATWRDALAVTVRSGGDISTTLGLVRPEVASLAAESWPREPLEVALPAFAELAVALDAHPDARDLRDLVQAATERWCSQSTDQLRAQVEGAVRDALAVGPSAAGRLPNPSLPDLSSCGPERATWIRASDRLREELGWSIVSVDLHSFAAGPGVVSTSGRDDSSLLLVPVVAANRLLLVAAEPVSALAWRAVAGDGGGPSGSGSWLKLTIDQAQSFCDRLGEFAYLGRRWRAVLPDEETWRAVWQWHSRTNPSADGLAGTLRFDAGYEEWLVRGGRRDAPEGAAPQNVNWRHGDPRIARDDGGSMTVLRPFFEAVDPSGGSVDPRWIEAASNSIASLATSGATPP